MESVKHQEVQWIKAPRALNQKSQIKMLKKGPTAQRGLWVPSQRKVDR